MLRLVNQTINASSFSRVVDYMNNYDCMFITAFRHEYSVKENRRRNKELAADIHGSDLTYIKAFGGFIERGENPDGVRVTEDTFCVVNNGYRTEDFIKLAVSWCKKYDQDSVLVTIPTQDKTRNHAINVIGRYYDQNGNIDMQFDHANVQDAQDYFTNICGKDFVLSSTDISVSATEYEPYSGTAGYIKAMRRFKDRYPEL